MGVHSGSPAWGSGCEHSDEFRQIRPRLVIRNGLAVLRQPHIAGEMALLADRIARSGRQPRRVDDVVAPRMRRMSAAIAVASLATDGLNRGETRDTVERPKFGPGAAGVTEQAFGRDGAAEIGLDVFLIAGGHVPSTASSVDDASEGSYES